VTTPSAEHSAAHCDGPRKVVFLPHWHLNPYQDQLADGLASLGIELINSNRRLWLLKALLGDRPDIVHLHWLDYFYRSKWAVVRFGKLCVSLAQLTLLQWLGARLVWTVHNLRDHEDQAPKLERFFTALVVRRAAAMIVHCEEAAGRLVAQLPGVVDPSRIHVVPHGSYQGVYPNQITKAAAREQLGIDPEALVLLLFGALRRYKGATDLVDAFAQLAAPATELWIVGQPRDHATDSQLKQCSNACPQVTYRPGFVPAEQIQLYMNACDVVVFPYRDTLTSGAVVLAMSFARACIAPRRGCLASLLDDAGGFLYDPGDPDGLASALRQAIASRDQLSEMGRHNSRQIAPWDWHRVATLTRAVYATLPHPPCRVPQKQ
jgi:beta-1,4-mannosyltransferase